MNEEELWKRAHSAYRELLKADLVANEAESKWYRALSKLFPEAYPIKEIMGEGDFWRISTQEAVQKTKRLSECSLEEFKQLTRKILSGDK